MRSVTNRTLATTFAGLAAAALLAGCDRVDDSRTAGQQLDTAVAKTEAKAEVMGDKIAAASSDAAAQVKDAAITTAVNAQLAGDSSLSALKIDVDTSNGAVMLKGTAPDAASKDHATALAQRIDGVTSVDNQLVVPGK